jgi:hypothetical protein
LIVIAYSLATMHGQPMKNLGIETYAGRIKQHQDTTPRHSDFSFALYGQLWIYGMELWTDLALSLMALKPHKRLIIRNDNVVPAS